MFYLSAVNRLGTQFNRQLKCSNYMQHDVQFSYTPRQIHFHAKMRIEYYNFFQNNKKLICVKKSIYFFNRKTSKMLSLSQQQKNQTDRLFYNIYLVLAVKVECAQCRVGIMYEVDVTRSHFIADYRYFHFCFHLFVLIFKLCKCYQ